MDNVIKQEVKKYETKKTLFKSYQIIWYLVYLIEVLIFLRIIFRLLGANPASDFVSTIYLFSQIFVLPFLNIFPSPNTSGFVLDAPAIIAAIIYPLGASIIMRLFQLIKPVSHEEVSAIEDTNIPTP